jgi:oligopeptide/dipeptide ABC transporter ATP-binding protein
MALHQTSGPPLLDVRDLRTTFRTRAGDVRAVDGVSFSIAAGQSLGVVGESGSGKSVTSLSLVRLFPPTANVRMSGEVHFDGRDLMKASEAELRAVRGGQISIVFQDPLTSLNPVLPVGEQIAESVRLHLGFSRKAARARAVELLALVGIPDPQRRVDDLPQRFSGGMRQRVMIAIAIACEPKLLIADEATTALDVTIQAQILALLDKLRRELGMAMMVISHDLGVVAAICDTVQVMYAGQVVERSPVEALLRSPEHPYSRGLLRLVPKLDTTRHNRLRPIPGYPPTVLGEQTGCRFRPRCEVATDRCAEQPPPFEVGAQRWSACWLSEHGPTTHPIGDDELADHEQPVESPGVGA